jgi:hypothetical protein
MSNEFIALLANIALTLSFIAALVFGVVQLREAAGDRKERLTLETLRSVQTREFAELILFINLRSFPTTGKELNALPMEDQAKIVQFAQQMESLGLLVEEGYLDMQLVDKTLGSFVTTAWRKYCPMFTDMRETMGDPFLGEYFQWLAEQIEKNMRERPRKPVFKA